MTAALPAVAAEADVPFHVASIDEDDIAAVVAVLRSGWLTTGPRAREFEQAFALHLGGDAAALAVNSCTSALHLALEAVGVGAGDYVITSPYTFTATAEVVRYLGAHPVFADVDPITGNLTAASVVQAYEQLPQTERHRVRALVAVHFAGLPCEMERLVPLAAAHGWALVDDAAHALPAARQGRPIGTWGDATAFSFYATKTLCTGEGGMLTSPHPALLERARVMRLHGIDADAFDRYSRPDAWRYSVVAPGFKYNMTDIAAALGLSQLRKLVEMRDARAAVAASYDEAFLAVDGLGLPARTPLGDEHAWHLYPLRVLAGPLVRDGLVRALAGLGVGSSVHFQPLHVQPYYRDAYQLAADEFPGAMKLQGQEISLPLFPGMTSAQVERVVDAVQVGLRSPRVIRV